MNYSTEGLYYYIDYLVQHNKIHDLYFNKFENQNHHGFCFSIKKHLFLMPSGFNDIKNRQFFCGMILKEHHFSIERSPQDNSNVHYTCHFENPNNTEEYLKFSVFFHKENHQKITRVSYYYITPLKMIKGDIPLNSSDRLDLSKEIFHKIPQGNETIQFKQLIDMAQTAFKYRLMNYLSNFHKMVELDTNNLHEQLKKFRTLNDEFKLSKYQDLSSAQKALIHIDKAIEIFKKMKVHYFNNPTLVDLEKYKTTLENEIKFTQHDNLKILQEDFLNSNTENSLVKAFKHNKISPLDDPLKAIQKIYDYAVVEGFLFYVQYIHNHFFMDLNPLPCYEKLINRIDANEAPDKAPKRIEVSNFLFDHSKQYHEKMRQHIENDDHDYFVEPGLEFELDVLSGMFLKNNLLAFTMYLQFSSKLASFDSDNLVKQIKKLSEYNKSHPVYIEAIENNAEYFKGLAGHQ